MYLRIRNRRLAPVLVVAVFAAPSLARAVEVLYGPPPQAYAVTFLNEEWLQNGAVGNAEGYIEETEQLSGTETIASFQQAGIDALGPGGGCTPPCTGMTAEATATYGDGAVTLSASSHSYADFDAVDFIELVPETLVQPGYHSGNIVRAEATAAVIDLLTVTKPVQLTLQGRFAGENSFASASDAEQYADQLSSADFGNGRCTADVVASLTPTPIVFTVYDLGHPMAGAYSDESHVFTDEAFGSTAMLGPGDYVLKLQLRTYTRIGSVSAPNLAVMDLRSDFFPAATFRLVADDPSAVSSASGLLTFAPEPDAALLGDVALAGLGWLAIRRNRRRTDSEPATG